MTGGSVGQLSSSEITLAGCRPIGPRGKATRWYTEPNRFNTIGMSADEKSDINIVPKKAPNYGAQATAEALEERTMTKGNSEKAVCDLHAEAGGSIEQTRQNT